MPGVLFDVSEYEANQWKYRLLVDESVTEAERAGRVESGESFGRFAEDVFHRMIAETERPREENPAGSDVWRKLHGEMDKLPEVTDLRERCQGDEVAAGLATAAVMDSVRGVVSDEQAKTGERAEAARSAAEMLEAMLANDDDPDVRRCLDELNAEIGDAEAEAGAAADQIDPSWLRQAVRVACREANREVDGMYSMVNGFMAGTGREVSKARRGAVARELAESVKKRPALQRIAELAGRLRRVAARKQEEKARRGTDEIVGVETGRDLGRLVPAEWAISNDPDLEDLFYQRYLEGSLVQLEVEGKETKGRGPVVVAIDCSGSMSGTPAEWAGAVTLALVDIVVRQKRDLELLWFDTSIRRQEKIEGTRVPSVSELINSVTFEASGGGTDFDAALANAFAMISRHGEMSGADVIVITDGYASVSSSTSGQLDRLQKEVGLSLYGILVGGAARSTGLEGVANEVYHVRDVMKDEEMHDLFGAI